MAYQKNYKNEINIYDLLARFNELGYRAPKELNSNQKSTTILVEIKEGVEVEFAITEKNKLKFDLHLPYSWKRRMIQIVIAFVLLVFSSILSKQPQTYSDDQTNGLLAYLIKIIGLLFISGMLPYWFANNSYKAKHPNVLNDIAQDLNEI